MNEIFISCGELVTVKINGNKLPLVESISCETKKKARPVEAFGEAEPVETVSEKAEYRIKIMMNSDDVGLHNADDFTLTLENGDKTVTYRKCRCENVQSVNKVGEPERVSAEIFAATREEE